jgi:hypothetical protein
MSPSVETACLSIAAASLGMGGSRTVHHQMKVGAVESNVTQQMVVELQQAGVGTALIRTAEERGEDVHFDRPFGCSLRLPERGLY